MSPKRTKTTDLKRRLTTKSNGAVEPVRRFLPTGSTLLNLACSGNRSGGFPAGSYVFLVGDSASGKTFLSLTCFAEACLSKHFQSHRLIFNDVEGGAMMDFEKFFGRAVADKIEMRQSATIEDFYDDIDDDCKRGRPFIYVLDSMDGLSSEAEGEKFQEQKTARRANRAASGSYGDGKAKKNSSGIRRLLTDLRRTGSILIVISQTRDNLGFGFEKKTRSGGRALRFYASLELWSAVKGKIKKTVNGQPRQIGITCEIQVKKNRVTGRETTIEIPIHYSAGLDDTGSCVEFLEKEGKLNLLKSNTKNQERLIQKIESEGRELELRRIVSDVWHEIEKACAVERRPRYQ